MHFREMLHSRQTREFEVMLAFCPTSYVLCVYPMHNGSDVACTHQSIAYNDHWKESKYSNSNHTLTHTNNKTTDQRKKKDQQTRASIILTTSFITGKVIADSYVWLKQ